MYKLFSIAGSCSTGVHVLMNQLGLHVDVIERSSVDNYQSIVPTNQVPALKDGDKIVTEGAAIVLYLLEKHGSHYVDEEDKSDFIQKLMFNYATLHPAYGRLYSIRGLMEEGAEKEKLMHILADKVSDLWKIVDQHLAENDFMVGSRITVVDYLLAIYASWGNGFSGLKIDLGKHVISHIKKVKNDEFFKLAYKRENIAFQIPEA